MSPLLPPVFRGKIPTTPGRLLLAVVAMLGLDLLLLFGQGLGVFAMNFWQAVILVGVLLLSPRRWVALLLMAPASLLFLPVFSLAVGWESVREVAVALLPLLLGVFVAWPRPRRRVVVVEEEEA